MTVYKCLHGLAPKYLAELCVPVAHVAAAVTVTVVVLAGCVLVVVQLM